MTGFDNVARRDALRATWVPSTTAEHARLEKSTGLVVRFILGYTNDTAKELEVQGEISRYGDFLRVDVEEFYLNLNHKTLKFFQAALELYDADFYVKADDDVYLRPDRLATLLARERASRRVYLGCMKKGPVITDSRLKWFEPQHYMLGAEYFLHAYGPIYALGADVVQMLASFQPGSLRMFSNEDVTVGGWMLSMNVAYEDNRGLCAPACGPRSIAVWDIPTCSGLCNAPVRMLELHKQDICSKSPTVPDEGR
eukprot:jgi/Mesen1/10082/ME000074S09421